MNNSATGPYRRRLLVLLSIFILALSVIVIRAAKLQLFQNDKLQKLAKRQFHSQLIVQAQRGLILDRNGTPLAINTESLSLAVHPGKLVEKLKLAKSLSIALGIPLKQVITKINSDKNFVWMKRHMSKIESNKLKQANLIDENGATREGLWVIKENKREYPQGELAGHVLGSVNIDGEGIEGLELWKNEKLKGKEVAMRSVKDALGRSTYFDASSVRGQKDGETIQLSLDSGLQFAVEQELKKAVKHHKASGGSVTVMNAVSGEILAMAPVPDFNPNFRAGNQFNRRNRIVTDGFEPGSIVKPIVAAGAFSNGIKPTDQVWGNHGSLKIQGKVISEAESEEKFGWMTIGKMIQVSSNVGAAKLGLQLGTEKLFGILNLFGMGHRTQIGFPGEISGWLPPEKTAKPLTLANLGFGHGLFVTPIQMIRAYSVFLNGGWLIHPTLLKDPNGSESLEIPKRIISEKIARDITEILFQATSKDGTGFKSKVDGYRIAGKTGTAQVVDPETRKYSTSQYVSSFIGFALDVEPKIVIMTQIDRPKGVYYASDTAAPLFANVFRSVANRFSLPENRTLMDGTKQLAGVPTALPDPGTDFVETTQSQIVHDQSEMPNLFGLSAREVIQSLDGRGFNLVFSGHGLVKDQKPSPGEKAARGAEVKIIFSE